MRSAIIAAWAGVALAGCIGPKGGHIAGTQSDWVSKFHPEEHVKAPLDYDRDTRIVVKVEPEAAGDRSG